MDKKVSPKGLAKRTTNPPIKVITKKKKQPSKAPGNANLLKKGRGARVIKDEKDFTEKELRFVEYYTISWNKSEAVRNAGYECINPGSVALELLKKPHIHALVEERRAAFREQTSDLRDQLTAALSESAFYDYSEFFELKEVEKKVGRKTIKVIEPVFKTTDALAKGAGKLISSMKIGKDHRIELKLDDKHQARLLLAEHIGYKELDNLQKRSDAVAVYIPDNGRGDYTKPDEKKK